MDLRALILSPWFECLGFRMLILRSQGERYAELSSLKFGTGNRLFLQAFKCPGPVWHSDYRKIQDCEVI
jgi:hypothetical protein